MAYAGALRGILRAMRSGADVGPDLNFSPLVAWLRPGGWGNMSPKIRRAPTSIQMASGDPSPYLLDNIPVVLAKSDEIIPSLNKDILAYNDDLIQRNAIRFLPENQRRMAQFEYLRSKNPISSDMDIWRRVDEDRNKTVEELLNELAWRDNLIRYQKVPERMFYEEKRLNDLVRARDQISTFSDLLRQVDPEQILTARSFDVPYYGLSGNFLPRVEFARRAAPPYIPPTDIPF